MNEDFTSYKFQGKVFAIKVFGLKYNSVSALADEFHYIFKQAFQIKFRFLANIAKELQVEARLRPKYHWLKVNVIKLGFDTCGATEPLFIEIAIGPPDNSTGLLRHLFW